MVCTPVKMPGGGTAFVCGPRPKVKRCSCGARGTLLCDWKTGKTAAGKVKTCDRPICSAHAREVAPDKHLCPEHSAAYDEWLAKRKDAP